jgi:hypothetical protein
MSVCLLFAKMEGTDPFQMKGPFLRFHVPSSPKEVSYFWKAWSLGNGEFKSCDGPREEPSFAFNLFWGLIRVFQKLALSFGLF